MSARIFGAFFLKCPAERGKEYLLQTFRVSVLVPRASSHGGPPLGGCEEYNYPYLTDEETDAQQV